MYGDSLQPCLVAVVVPAAKGLMAWAAEAGVQVGPWTGRDEGKQGTTTTPAGRAVARRSACLLSLLLT